MDDPKKITPPKPEDDSRDPETKVDDGGQTDEGQPAALPPQPVEEPADEPRPPAAAEPVAAEPEAAREPDLGPDPGERPQSEAEWRLANKIEDDTPAVDHLGDFAPVPPTDRVNPITGQTERTFYDPLTGKPRAAFVIAPDRPDDRAATPAFAIVANPPPRAGWESAPARPQPWPRSETTSPFDDSLGAPLRMVDDPRFIRTGGDWIDTTVTAGKKAYEAYQIYQGYKTADAFVRNIKGAVDWPPDTPAAEVEPPKGYIIEGPGPWDIPGRTKHARSGWVLNSQGERLGKVYTDDNGFTFVPLHDEERIFSAPIPRQQWNSQEGLVLERALAYGRRVDKLGPGVARLLSGLLTVPLNEVMGLMFETALDKGSEAHGRSWKSPRDEAEAFAIEAAFEVRMAQLRDESRLPPPASRRPEPGPSDPFKFKF